MIKGSFINSLPLQLKSLIQEPPGSPINESWNLKASQYLIEKLLQQKGIIFTESDDIQLKLFDVDSTISSQEFDSLVEKLDKRSQILLCDKIKLIYGFDSLTSFIIRLVNILNFSQFFSIFDITSNIKLYGFYSLNYKNPVEILVKQIRHDLFIVKSFKEFTTQEMKKEHDFHLPYKEFKRLNLNDGNLVVVKILFKNEQKPIDLALIEPLLPNIEMLHLSLENESKLKPFNDMIDQKGSSLKYLKFGVNRGIFKKIPIKNNIETLKLVNIDNLNFINDLQSCLSLDVFFDNWELRKNCDIKFQQNFIIKFEVMQKIEHLKTLNIFHTYLDSKDLNKLKLFPNLTHSKISYVILDNDGFDLSECKNLQELKIHFTYQKTYEDPIDQMNPAGNIHWPSNLKKLSVTIHNIKNLIQNFSIRLNILRKIAKPLPPSIVDLCIDISYDTGGSGPESYSISRDDILKISSLINNILTNNLENLKLKGISRYNYKIGKPLIFSAINFPQSLKLLSLNDFILDFNFINLPNLKKLYFEHSLFDSDFKLPDSDEILIEKCTFKDLTHIPPSSSKIEFKMCTFRKIPSYSGSVENIIINNCRVMEQPTNNVFQFQQQIQMNRQNTGSNSNSNYHHNNKSHHNHHQQQQLQQNQKSQQQQQQHLTTANHVNSNGDNGMFSSPLLKPQYSNSHRNNNTAQSTQQVRTQSLPYSQNSLSTSGLNDYYHPNPQISTPSSVHPQFPLFPSQSFSGVNFSTFNTSNTPASNTPLFEPDLNNFLNKDLEYQLANMSLSSPNYQQLPSPQPMMLNMNLSSPPASSPSTTGATYHSQQQGQQQTQQHIHPAQQQTQQIPGTPTFPNESSFHMSSQQRMGSLSSLLNQFNNPNLLASSPDSINNHLPMNGGSPQFGFGNGSTNASNRNSIGSASLNNIMNNSVGTGAANLQNFIDDFSLNNATWTNLNGSKDSPFNSNK